MGTLFSHICLFEPIEFNFYSNLLGLLDLSLGLKLGSSAEHRKLAALLALTKRARILMHPYFMAASKSLGDRVPRLISPDGEISAGTP